MTKIRNGPVESDKDGVRKLITVSKRMEIDGLSFRKPMEVNTVIISVRWSNSQEQSISHEDYYRFLSWCILSNPYIL